MNFISFSKIFSFISSLLSESHEVTFFLLVVIVAHSILFAIIPYVFLEAHRSRARFGESFVWHIDCAQRKEG